MNVKTPDLSRFFAPEIGISGTYLLDPEESRHAVKVLRLNTGDLLELADGKGSFYTCSIIEFSKKGTLLKIQERHFTEHRSSYRLNLVVSPTKNTERFEWLLEKACEIGIDEITPLVCQRSEKRDINNERLQKILIAAMKQSLNVWLPVVHPVIEFKEFIKQPFSGLSAIAHCLNSQKTNLSEVFALTPEVRNIRILIGPEGDFTESEIGEALNAGFKPLSLGKSRLRTETAGIVACTELAMIMRRLY